MAIIPVRKFLVQRCFAPKAAPVICGPTRVERKDPIIAEHRARAIIEHYQDKAFTYCDAVSFAVMERLEIQEAITFDEHFRQYGQFTIL